MYSSRAIGARGRGSSSPLTADGGEKHREEHQKAVGAAHLLEVFCVCLGCVEDVVILNMGLPLREGGSRQVFPSSARSRSYDAFLVAFAEAGAEQR